MPLQIGDRQWPQVPDRYASHAAPKWKLNIYLSLSVSLSVSHIHSIGYYVRFVTYFEVAFLRLGAPPFDSYWINFWEHRQARKGSYSSHKINIFDAKPWFSFVLMSTPLCPPLDTMQIEPSRFRYVDDDAYLSWRGIFNWIKLDLHKALENVHMESILNGVTCLGVCVCVCESRDTPFVSSNEYKTMCILHTYCLFICKPNEIYKSNYQNTLFTIYAGYKMLSLSLSLA